MILAAHFSMELLDCAPSIYFQRIILIAMPAPQDPFGDFCSLPAPGVSHASLPRFQTAFYRSPWRWLPRPPSLTQRMDQGAQTWLHTYQNPLRSFTNSWCLAATPRDSDLRGLGRSLGFWIFKRLPQGIQMCSQAGEPLTSSN